MHRATQQSRLPAGAFTRLGNEEFYRISGYHRMAPFLMTLSSDTDLWMFVTSGGGLTAGRMDADRAILPYETVDKLHDAHAYAGPITLIRAARGGGTQDLWQPFGPYAADNPGIERNLYKNIPGNRVVFEEIHHGLELRFRYRWAGCDEFGWVRTAVLENLGAETVRIELLDGLRHVLPFGIPLEMQQKSSTLADAYKQAEWDPATGLAVYSLTSRIVDRPEAAEELRANVVWSRGLPDFSVSLDAGSVEAFHAGVGVDTPRLTRGRRGNYLATSAFALAPDASKTWHLAADVGLDAVQVARLNSQLLQVSDMHERVEKRLEQATDNLTHIVAQADGIQLTGDRSASAHHFANVLFNGMRGGFVDDGYRVSIADLLDFIKTRNSPAFRRLARKLSALAPSAEMEDIRNLLDKGGDVDGLRLFHEYVPLFFSRRHGDPSRPWNRFAIRLRGENGRRALRYEGNWRDIFQNWEALAAAYPGFLPHFVAKFVNASTADGFNPYRINRDGIDWEVPDPDDPWSHIGYWGDHQITYLHRLLDLLHRHDPDYLPRALGRSMYSFADVPYRLKSYAEILADPHDTIIYDRAKARDIEARVKRLGTDGRLVLKFDGSIRHATLLEKLLIPVLSKLCNLVPDGGVWMNTQRPEWNDANNALVGHGLSMVTLAYLRAYLVFLNDVLALTEDSEIPVSHEVADWLSAVRKILQEERSCLDQDEVDDRDRRRVLDRLGEAFGAYREQLYERGLSGATRVSVAEADSLFAVALEFLDHALGVNRRGDGLFHAYNLLEAEPGADTAGVSHLEEMLEGQVAALSSGYVSPQDGLRLVRALRESALFREDQNSYLLYPERALPTFMEKNVIPEEAAEGVPLLQRCLESGDSRIVGRDAFGAVRFRGRFTNAEGLNAALDDLARDSRWEDAVAADRERVLDVFEQVFRHRAFTGRSGTMVAYEGIGSIYWHMVAKLLLAVQELVFRAADGNSSQEIQDALMESYYQIRSGLGFEKAAAEFGAFPTDPYSHTPGHAGAQQPGMTGQVKEMVLTRLGELGVRVGSGSITFSPVLLRRGEFLAEPSGFAYRDLDGRSRGFELLPGSLAFTYCQVPVVYTLSTEPGLTLTTRDGLLIQCEGETVSPEHSRSIFMRRGDIVRIDLGVDPDWLLP